MSPYEPANAFTASQIYDLSDLVKGGLDGDANVPLKALADQALYLKDRLPRWEGISVFTDSHEFDVDNDVRHLLVFQISDNKTLVLPQAGLLTLGTRIPVLAAIPGIKALTVEASEPIIDGSISWVKWDDNTQPAMYMHDGDMLILVDAGDHWLVEQAKGNFYNAGESYAGRKQARNTIVGNGTLYNRVDIPRVALFGLSLGDGIVPDGTWLAGADPNPTYRGCYSFGNGTTTIRVPDERAMVDKYLDLGRGLDLSRIYNSPGGFEPAQVGKFDLTIPATILKKSGNGNSILGLGVPNASVGGANPDPTFGTQPVTFQNVNAPKDNTVKSIGKIPLIRI